jgi:hypothetical protein
MPSANADVPRCGAQRINQPEGVSCTQPAGWRTDHPGIGRCARHGGSTPTHRRAADVAILKQTAARLGVPREVDPAQGILELVWEAAGNVEFYRQLLNGQPGLTAADDDADADAVALYGPTFHNSGIPTGEAKRHVLVQMYDEERDRLERYVKDALAAKVDERRVQLGEAQAHNLFSAVTVAMQAAEMTAEQAETFKRALATSLRAHLVERGVAALEAAR